MVVEFVCGRPVVPKIWTLAAVAESARNDGLAKGITFVMFLGLRRRCLVRSKVRRDARTRSLRNVPYQKPAGKEQAKDLVARESRSGMA